MEKEQQTQIVESLAKNEEKVSELYDLYADKFSDWNDFWCLLAGDEIAHANWIRDLYDCIEGDDIYFEENRFNIKAIKLFTDYLEESIKYAKEKDMVLAGALSTALDIENALIENKWFEIFEGDSIKVKRNLQRLKDALVKHRNKIAEALAQVKSG